MRNGHANRTKRTGHAGLNAGSVLQIARKVAATIGTDFFCAIAKHLAKALSADCVLLGEFVGPRMECVRTLCAHLDGAQAAFEYKLAGSASALASLGKSTLCRSEAQARFPTDTLLPMVHAQSFVAVPLQDSCKEPVGLIMALYREPQPAESLHAAKQILSIFSTRTAAELSRKRKEDELRESEQRYRAFIANNADAMWRIEFEHTIETSLPPEEQLTRMYQYGYVAECNDALARFLCRERAEQLIGSRVKDLDIAADLDGREDLLHFVRNGYQMKTVEISRIDCSGRQKHYLRSQQGIVEDGKLQRIWGTTRDISDLRHSERALDDSEQRLSDLLEALRLMVIIVDRHGLVTYCNRFFYQKTGWTASDVLGKEWIGLMMATEEHSTLRSTFDDEASRPEAPIHFQSTLLGPDGRRWRCEWDRAGLRDAEGVVTAWANVGRDVTEQKAIEEQFRQTQKLATIGRLSASVAHDFNNLLTVILGFSAALLEKMDPADRATQNLIQIRKAAEKGADLTRRLLAFGRRQVLRPEVLSPNAIIADAEDMVRRLIGDDIRLSIQLDPAAQLVKVDPGCLHQVLMNLAANARDAMPGGGELTIATSNTIIDKESEVYPGVNRGEYVKISVTDTGTGMSPEVLTHVFEPFFTTKAPGQGTGLGLSTVYGIVGQSGGHIFVDSKPGAGTVITILFPRVLQQTAPA